MSHLQIYKKIKIVRLFVTIFFNLFDGVMIRLSNHLSTKTMNSKKKKKKLQFITYTLESVYVNVFL